MRLSKESRSFLRGVWARQPLGYVFLCTREGGSMWEEHCMWRDVDKFPELPDEADVYFTPNVFSEPRRRKEFMLDSRWLYADLDRVDPYCVDEELEPTIAWCSSPERYQALWLLPRQLTPDTHQLINKQLTYRLQADRSGWDATQVLRVPGTQNYKYDEHPPVVVMWDNAPPIPELVTNGFLQMTPAPTQHTTRRPRKIKLPAGIHMKLGAKVATGDRSKVLWRLEKQLLEHGYSPPEVFALLKPTVWNKFDTDEQLEAEIARAAA